MAVLGQSLHYFLRSLERLDVVRLAPGSKAKGGDDGGGVEGARRNTVAASTWSSSSNCAAITCEMRGWVVSMRLVRVYEAGQCI